MSDQVMPPKSLGLLFALFGGMTAVSAVLRVATDLVLDRRLAALDLVLALVGVVVGVVCLIFGFRLRRKG